MLGVWLVADLQLLPIYNALLSSQAILMKVKHWIVKSKCIRRGKSMCRSLFETLE